MLLIDVTFCLASLTHFFFFSFANANVLLVLGELMGQGGEEQEGLTRSAIPLTAGAIVVAQATMAFATHWADERTEQGWGRKPLFLIGIATLPIRCALIILLKDAGHQYLLATQLFDGLGGGLFGLIHPFIVADITFGTGRFNAVSKFCASMKTHRFRKVEETNVVYLVLSLQWA